jgi:hypothetical protein
MNAARGKLVVASPREARQAGCRQERLRRRIMP